jgi:hypothetical protein
LGGLAGVPGPVAERGIRAGGLARDTGFARADVLALGARSLLIIWVSKSG